MKDRTIKGNFPVVIMSVLQHSIVAKKKNACCIFILQKVLDKIFQLFFTTKPTGQGTGLGLSLSYDIIKAHGCELSVGLPWVKVETKEGEGSEFVIVLP